MIGWFGSACARYDSFFGQCKALAHGHPPCDKRGGIGRSLLSGLLSRLSGSWTCDKTVVDGSAGLLYFGSACGEQCSGLCLRGHGCCGARGSA